MSENELQQMPANLIQIAIEKGSSVDALEKLMEMQTKWEAKEASKAFKQAMVDFQADKPELKKSEKVNVTLKTGGSMKYSFLPLSVIQKTIDPILSKHGLAYRWEQEESEGKIKITCVVSHILGHSERTYLTAPADTSGSKNAIQSIGSTVSYLKRYTLEGALGLSSDKDDDGAKVTKKPELTPESGRWNQAVLATKDGRIEVVKEQYSLSAENEALLRKEAGI